MTNATWKKNPASNNFNTAANWSPAAVPDGTAAFGVSNTTALSFSVTTTIGGWTFKADASTYNFNIPALGLGFDGVAFVGAGIVVKGGGANIANHDFLKFLNASTAGSAHIANSVNVSFYNSSTAGSAKFTNDNVIQFYDTSAAGRAHITNNHDGSVQFLHDSTAGRAHITNGFNANVEFFNDSTAAKSVIINNYILNFNHSSTAGAAHITNTGTILFLNNSTAGSATINSAIGGIAFLESSNAGNASITGSVRFYGNTTAGTAVVTPVDGGKVSFFDFSTGGGARFIAKVGTTVDFSQSGGIGGVITAGSIEGAGDYELNGSGGRLRVGFNNRSTKVSGAVDDTGGGTGAVLQKVGTGTLTLSHAGNTYSGGTVLTQGTLDIAAQGAAGTGAIYFDVGRQTLKIENTALANHAFSNVIGLFSVVDKIDLAGLKFVTHAKAHYDTVTHLLTVKSGHVTDTLTLITPGNGTFKAKDDGHGGTKVVLVPPAAKPIAQAAVEKQASEHNRDGHNGDGHHANSVGSLAADGFQFTYLAGFTGLDRSWTVGIHLGSDHHEASLNVGIYEPFGRSEPPHTDHDHHANTLPLHDFIL